VEAGNRTAQAGANGITSWILLELGRSTEAEARAAQCLELAQAIGNVAVARTAAAVLVLSRAALGTPPPASAAERIESDRANPADFALKSQLVSEALVSIGDLRRAAELAELGHRYAGGRLRELWATLALGYVKSLLGPANRREAEEWTRRALSLATDIGSRWGLAAASLAAAERALERGDRIDRDERCAEALRLGREMRLVRLVERAERLLVDDRLAASNAR
jgi:hypothetical protein